MRTDHRHGPMVATVIPYTERANGWHRHYTAPGTAGMMDLAAGRAKDADFYLLHRHTATELARLATGTTPE